MSTTSSLPTRHVLRPDDPSELLAEAQLLLRAEVTGRLVLIGHRDRRAVDVVSSTPLVHLLGVPDPVQHLACSLDLLRSQGVSGAFAIIVFDDADIPETPEDPNAAEEGLLPGAALAVQLLAASWECGPMGFDIPEVWLIADGCAQGIVLFREESGPLHADSEMSVAISPLRPLVPPEETSVMAQAVIEGRPLPLTRRTRAQRLEPLQEYLRPSLRSERRTPGTSGSGGEDWERSWGAVQDLLGLIRSGSPCPVGEEEARVIAATLRRLAHVEDFEALLDRLLRWGNRTRVPGELLLPEITRDARLQPHEDLLAGGAAHDALGDLLMLAESLELVERTPEGAEEISAAIVNLRLLLSVMDWWQYRFASGGDHADEALQRAPHRTFAQCLVQMTAAPLLPAWQPPGRRANGGAGRSSGASGRGTRRAGRR